MSSVEFLTYSPWPSCGTVEWQLNNPCLFYTTPQVPMTWELLKSLTITLLPATTDLTDLTTPPGPHSSPYTMTQWTPTNVSMFPDIVIFLSLAKLMASLPATLPPTTTPTMNAHTLELVFTVRTRPSTRNSNPVLSI